MTHQSAVLFWHLLLCSEQDKELLIEQQMVLRQLESILSILKLARVGQHVEALREIVNIKFLPLDPRSPSVSTDVVRNLNPHVQACVPDLLRVSLTCLDNVRDADGTIRALKSKVCRLSYILLLVYKFSSSLGNKLRLPSVKPF